MEFATWAWKNIEEYYDPKTPAAAHQKKNELKTAAANFNGDIPTYKNEIKSILADLGQDAPADDKIVKHILCWILNSSVDGKLSDITSWRYFVKEEGRYFAEVENM